MAEEQPVPRAPVVFVHGNGDAALGSGGALFNGWVEVLLAFMSSGYGFESLYGTTWGPGDPGLARRQSHDRVRVRHLRRFIEAVLAYTEWPRLNLVAHSMGVTLARKAVLGGRLLDERGWSDVGPSLASRVSTFVGIAGANQGLGVARRNPLVRVWNPINGFFPGFDSPLGPVAQSRFLLDVNRREREGARVYSIWSRSDGIVDPSLFGAPSGRIRMQHDEAVFARLNHFEVKDHSGPTLLDFIDE